MNALSQKTGLLGLKNAAHLLRRTSYHITFEKIEKFAKLTANQAFEVLVAPANPVVTEPIHPETKKKWLEVGYDRTATAIQKRELAVSIVSWWINEARLDQGVSHKMSFFLHTLFTVNVKANNEGVIQMIYDYLRLLDYHALGNIKQLAIRITLDNLMLNYLDNRLNSKGNPNENYAREFLELYTIGKGKQVGPGDYTNFTEHDVVEAARLLSGFRQDLSRRSIDPETGLPMGTANIDEHDTGSKTFSSAFGNKVIKGAKSSEDMLRELGEFVEMVFEKNATAQHICRRLYRYFVSSELTEIVEEKVITPLSQTLMDQNYEIEPVLRQLLCSKWFYDEFGESESPMMKGALLKSPLDLSLQLFNFVGFGQTFPDPHTNPYEHYVIFYSRWFLFRYLTPTGLPIFIPEVVAGYPAYFQGPGYDNNWFSSSTLLARYQLIEPFIAPLGAPEDDVIGGVRLDIIGLISSMVPDPGNARQLVSKLLGYLFCITPDEERISYFTDEILLGGLSNENWAYEWKQYLATGENEEEIRIPVSNLFRKIVCSQEYQLM